MLHGEEPERISAKEKQVRQWRLYHGLTEREAEVWWREKMETDRLRQKWETDQAATMGRELDQYRYGLATSGVHGQELDARVAQRRIELMDAAAVEFAKVLRGFREEQVARRKATGRML